MNSKIKKTKTYPSKVVANEDVADALTMLGQEFRRIRRYRDLALTDVGEVLGFSKSKLSLIENGNVGLQSAIDSYLRLAAYYGLEIHLVDSEGKNSLVLFGKEEEED